MELRVLGPLTVVVGKRAIPLGGLKQRSALAILALRAGHVVSRQELIDGMWGEFPPPSAHASLDTYISRLRRILAPGAGSARLVTQSPGYRLELQPGVLDLDLFQARVATARRAVADGDVQAAADGFTAALALFRGTPLEDLVRSPFAGIEIRRLEEQRLGVLEHRLDADLELGRSADVVGEIETLVALHPLREGLWMRLMLALYRSGRPGDALLAFDRARQILAEELGMDPGDSLLRLQSRILQQDPALMETEAAGGSGHHGSTETAPTVKSYVEPAPSDPKRPRPAAGARRTLSSAGRGPLLLVAAAALSLALGLAAVLIPDPKDPEPQAVATPSRPRTALIDASTGQEVGNVPLAEVAVSAYPVYADGHFWVQNFDPNSYVEIDPRSGAVVNQLTMPSWPVDVSEESGTLTPFAISDGILWAGSGHDLVMLDVSVDRVVDRLPLDQYVGGGSGLVEGVAVGDGSVWVGRSVGGGQIARLDPATGRVQHRFDDVTAHMQLAFANGSLWAADEDGLIRIDADTNTVVRAQGIDGTIWVAAGGGFGWTSDPTRGQVFKVDDSGRVVGTYATGLGAGFVGFTDGRLWVANRDEGTVTGIDAITGAETVLGFDHPTETLAAGDGTLLVYLVPGPTVSTFVDSLPEPRARFVAELYQLGQGDEPALNTHPGAIQIDRATCAQLLTHSDAPGPGEGPLRPEVAAAMPTVSRDGKTYTFRIRTGYQFSPPSNQPITAGTIRYSIERALSPKLEKNPTGQIPPGPQYVNDIQGERAYRSGRAEHISGLRARGDVLQIRLVEPSADFLERISLPYFCPVPLGTPVVALGLAQENAGGADLTIPGSGPYYVSRYANGEYVVLQRNPRYPGPREAHFDSIALLEGVSATIALDWVDRRGWDGITSTFDPAFEVGGPVDDRWGADSAGAEQGQQRYFLTALPGTRMLVFNSARGIFSKPWARKAAALALDRDALATAFHYQPTSQILPPALPGHRLDEAYPLRPTLGKARALMRGRMGHATIPVPPACDRCMDLAQVAKANLKDIGIDLVIVRTALPATAQGWATFDLADLEVWLPYPDSATFLTQLRDDAPRGWLGEKPESRIVELAGLAGDLRQRQAALLADRLQTRDVAMAAYGTPQFPQVIAPAVGCRAFDAFAYGLDLAAICSEP